MKMIPTELEAKYRRWIERGLRLQLVDNRGGRLTHQDIPWFVPLGMEVVNVLSHDFGTVQFSYWSWNFVCSVGINESEKVVELTVLDRTQLEVSRRYTDRCLFMLNDLAAKFGTELNLLIFPSRCEINIEEE